MRAYEAISAAVEAGAKRSIDYSEAVECAGDCINGLILLAYIAKDPYVLDWLRDTALRDDVWRYLADMGIADFERRGPTAYYRLHPEKLLRLAEMRRILKEED